MDIVETDDFKNKDQINKADTTDVENISPIPKGTEVWWRYGNYCGPGPLRNKTCNKLINEHPLPSPKDKIDQACMEHDLNYCQSGLGWRDAYTFKISAEAVVADRQLIQTLTNLDKNDQLNWKERLAARTIIGFFSLRHKFLINKEITNQINQQLPSSGNG